MALNDSVNILKVTLPFTGSQCKDRKTGVMWSYLDVLVINLAAAFCTRCSLDMAFFGSPYNRLLVMVMVMYLCTAHIPIRFMAVNNAINGIGIGRR